MDNVDSFICVCDSGFTGVHCESDINECEDRYDCGNGTCINEVGSYSCKCPHGSTGRHCETYICETLKCEHGDCTSNGDETFECDCYYGYYGNRCQKQVTWDVSMTMKIFVFLFAIIATFSTVSLIILCCRRETLSRSSDDAPLISDTIVHGNVGNEYGVSPENEESALSNGTRNEKATSGCMRIKDWLRS